MTTAYIDSPAWGLGLATVTASGQVLDVWFPAGNLGLGAAPFASAGASADSAGAAADSGGASADSAGAAVGSAGASADSGGAAADSGGAAASLDSGGAAAGLDSGGAAAGLDSGGAAAGLDSANAAPGLDPATAAAAAAAGATLDPGTTAAAVAAAVAAHGPDSLAAHKADSPAAHGADSVAAHGTDSVPAHGSDSLAAHGADSGAVGGIEVGAGSDVATDFSDISDLSGSSGARLGLRAEVVRVEVQSLGDAPAGTADVYLRLHLLSHRIVRPHQVNLDGQFGLLANVAWTSAGPCLPEQVDELRAAERRAGRRLNVFGVDKFPRMVDYVTPSGVRIADADRVRLGAHLAPGTTVMHEGFVNFNAGTLGNSMVEGRISAGVVVGDGTDVGGGASIMGTLSGGGKETISLGERCLLGANAGIGISLGDDCVVEAGCYITAGAKLTLPDGRVVKARELSGLSNLLFIRNSVNGRLEVRERQGRGIELNAALHAN